MSKNPSELFAEALNQLETDGDVDIFVSAVFAPDPRLVRPETGQAESGVIGAHEFWSQYLHQFADITSKFSRVVHGEVGVLEWNSRGHLKGGQDIDYNGITVLNFDTDDKVTRLATYYDTQAFAIS